MPAVASSGMFGLSANFSLRPLNIPILVAEATSPNAVHRLRVVLRCALRRPEPLPEDRAHLLLGV